jgi:hypothetical protein
MKIKKIYDITPPWQTLDQSQYQSQNTKGVNKQNNKQEIKKYGDNQNNSFWSLFFIFFGLFLLACISLYIMIDPKISIEIKPKISQFQTTAKILGASGQNDKNAPFIQTQEIIGQKQFSQDVPTTKQDGSSKARGVLTMYNEYSDQPQSFIAGTRFVEENGKIFISLEKVTIPGKKGNTPGTINVKVESAEAGPDYNIAPTTFSIPKLRSTPYYTKFYAKSTSPMQGGSNGDVFIVTQEDVDTCKKMLEDKAFNVGIDILSEQFFEYTIIKDSEDFDVIYPDYSKQLGEQSKTFNCQGDVKVKALAIKNSDLQSFSLKYIKDNISKQKKIIEKTLKTQLDASDPDLSSKTARLSLQISADSYFAFDFNDLKQSILGMKKGDLAQFIFNKYGEKIDDLRFKLSPFWRTDVPKKAQDISVSLEGVD